MAVAPDQISQPAIGLRVQALRAFRTLTVDQLAEKAELEIKTLTAIEGGGHKPTATDLVRIAKAMKMSVYDLVTGQDDSGKIRAKYRSAEGSAAEREAINDVLDATKVISDLRLLRRLVVPTNIAMKAGIGDVAHQARQAALATRKKLEVGGEPMPNVARLLRGKGFVVVEHELPSSISGVLLHRKGGHFIIVNSNEPPTRRNFSVAHELGHAVLDSDEELIVSHIGDEGAQERRAEAFASEFLIPEATLRRDLAAILNGAELNLLHVTELAVHYSVSYAAMLIAIRRIHPLTPQKAKDLWDKQPNANAIRLGTLQSPSTYQEPSIVRVAAGNIATAYRDNLISYAKARELATYIGLEELPSLDPYRYPDEDLE